ncbi:hypothetical protein [Archangium lipolyticum]|uniref:hypothetical protein n=1 Tax=Archangium lipolyticum TaxID=2970465 RepID=UPI00214A1DF5|nr:hypothetical protein [Archangium lipolyticum]
MVLGEHEQLVHRGLRRGEPLARRVVRTGGHGAGGELARAREAGLTDAEVVAELDWPKAPALPGT